MNLKQYTKRMLFVAIPATLLGYLLAFATMHSGGIVFNLSFTLVPGLWFVDKLGLTDSLFVWPVALLVQVLYWSVIITVFNSMQKSNEKNT